MMNFVKLSMRIDTEPVAGFEPAWRAKPSEAYKAPPVGQTGAYRPELIILRSNRLLSTVGSSSPYQLIRTLNSKFHGVFLNNGAPPNRF